MSKARFYIFSDLFSFCLVRVWRHMWNFFFFTLGNICKLILFHHHLPFSYPRSLALGICISLNSISWNALLCIQINFVLGGDKLYGVFWYKLLWSIWGMLWLHFRNADLMFLDFLGYCSCLTFRAADFWAKWRIFPYDFHGVN